MEGLWVTCETGSISFPILFHMEAMPWQSETRNIHLLQVRFHIYFALNATKRQNPFKQQTLSHVLFVYCIVWVGTVRKKILVLCYTTALDMPGWGNGARVVSGSPAQMNLVVSGVGMCQLQHVRPLPQSTTSCLSLGAGPGRNPVRGGRFRPFYLLCWVNS